MPINIDTIRTIVIEEVIEETPTVKTFIFKDSVSSNAKPGQFLMVWIPRVEELPMSVMVAKKEGYAAVTIRRRGFGSTALFNKRTGEILGVRGPYGKHFKILKNSKKVLMVGGGTGLVPLLRLATWLNKARISSTLIIGAKSREEVFFEKYANDILSDTEHNVIVATEDGKYGVKGYVTDVLAQIIDKREIDHIYTCGPELMMKKAFDIASTYSIPIQASLERYMKCGIGICASCCIGDQVICKDGTIFNERQLSMMKEFGIIYRDKSGRKSGYF